ncbi:MAG: MarR family winged helix-turn-helix transcriptional regulator [Xanthobacteraceae bacterium]|nr:MarR family winged helix-turn-helix transcriptional regulator [Xanthobacteraceae bacterium]PWB61425.1 MAG: MarR family transcriptional regulator [Bradyrhizobiaceae bacterium]
MAGNARKRAAGAAPTAHPRKAARRVRPMPLTISRPELIINGRDKEFRELVHNLFGFLALHERIRAGHARFIGLAGIEYTVLISIAHLSLEGDVNIKTVADHLHLSGAFITSTAQRLLRLGLIHKTVDSADRRRVTLTVSNKGRAALEGLAPVQRRINDAEFSCLSRKEFKWLNGLTRRLIECGEEAVSLQTYLHASARP